MDELDPIERQFGKSVMVMTASELLSYIKEYFNAYGVDLVVDDMVDRKTLEAFQLRYTRGRAGQIVQWVMLRRRGRKDGRFITPSIFSKPMKWWTDEVWMEIQADRECERRTAASEVVFADMRSLIDLQRGKSRGG